jgi:hypothetical protein
MIANLQTESETDSNEIFNLNLGELKCAACSGPGCRECLWFGTEVVRAQYLETKRLVSEFSTAA